MTATQSQAALSLELTRALPAPRARVFEAWTNAEALAQWFSPSADMKVEVHELDAQVGGRYRISMHEPDGVHTVAGEYFEVQSSEKLVFSFCWEHDENQSIMQVTVELTDRGETTELRLLHEKLPDAEWRDEHNKGWNGCLSRLETCVSA